MLSNVFSAITSLSGLSLQISYLNSFLSNSTNPNVCFGYMYLWMLLLNRRESLVPRINYNINIFLMTTRKLQDPLRESNEI